MNFASSARPALLFAAAAPALGFSVQAAEPATKTQTMETGTSLTELNDVIRASQPVRSVSTLYDPYSDDSRTSE